MTKDTLVKDALSSIVVCLVAVPLCLGIAIASGASPAAGLVSGIIGGLVAGSLTGCPLIVSGPAAGLITMVWETARVHGPEGLTLVIAAAGAVQLALGALGLGRWFRAVSPGVVEGMLAGIGLSIFASQFHVMLDAKPAASALANLASIPSGVLAAAKAGTPALWVGAATIAAITAWTSRAPARLKLVPGGLIGVALAAAAVALLGLPVAKVQLGDGLLAGLRFLTPASLGRLADPSLLAAALGMAFVASAETLLTATAVDRFHTGPRTRYNREILAQGAANLVSGVVGGLPITGVIARSAANIQAGARTNLSTVMHGAWLALFAFALPGLLGRIPVSALASILVLTGAKLMSPKPLRELWEKDRGEALVFLVTAAVVVSTNLLNGIVAGLALAGARAAWSLLRENGGRFKSMVTREGEKLNVALHGGAAFIHLPQLAETLEGLPSRMDVSVEAWRLRHADHAVRELLRGWEADYGRSGGRARVLWDTAAP